MGKGEDNILIDITSLGFKGEGIANADGKTIFVPFALPNEKISAKIVFQKDNLVFAHAKKIVVKSPHRTEPVCPVFGECGGCDLQHMSYQKQLEFKGEIVKRNIKKIAGIDVEVAPTVPSPLQYRYRNKLVLPLSQRDGKIVTGFYKEGTNEMVDTLTCPLHALWADKLIVLMRQFMEKYDVAPYAAAQKRGLARHLVARKLGETLVVTVVVFGENLPHKDKLLEMMQTAFGKVSLFLNTNKKEGNAVTGERYIFVGGEENLQESIDGLSISVHPAAFFQVNDGIRKILYKDVASLCGGAGVLIDAYSGAGVLTAILARRFDKVYGIEIAPQAVEAANDLTKQNGIKNVQNILGDCGQVLPRLLSQNVSENENLTVVLDPPRKGCDEAVIAALAKHLPQKIVYISCNSSTLARDLARLGLHSINPPYKIISATPYDMFPQTRHLETLVCLSAIKQK